MRIDGHLLIPFGRPKWDIEKIRVVGVSTTATYFESETPCVYIDANKQVAVRLRHFPSVFPESDSFPWGSNTSEAIVFVREYLKRNCHVQTDSESRFLDLYFDFCQSAVVPRAWEKENLNRPVPRNDPEWVFDSLLPLPQAHLYLTDPLKDEFSFVPKNMVKVDFAFWTGNQVIAVEIDGSSHVGRESHVQKDRLLQRAGVMVVHILNSELLKYSGKAISALLPRGITHFWENAEDKERANPLIPF